MENIQVLKGLSLIYDKKNDKEKLEKALNFIKKNAFLFSDLINEDNGKVINVNEFEDFVENIVNQVIQDEQTKKAIENEDFLPSFYLTYLILKNDMVGNTIFEIPKNVTMELVLFLMSVKYYNYNLSDICKTLFSENSEEYEKIISCVKDSQRINAYNYLLKYMNAFFEEHDSVMLDNLESIINEIISNGINYFNALINENEKTSDLKKLSEFEFDNLFIDFLNDIKAPAQWVNIYQYLKTNRLISFEYSDEVENGQCYLDDKLQIRKIELIGDGTIRTFVTFVHEFIHYVSLINFEDIDFSLIEFPSIYFENIAAMFLKNKGYDEKIVEDVLNTRNTNNCSLFIPQIIQLKEILEYRKNGLFSIEKRIEFNRNMIDGINQSRIKMAKLLQEAGVQEIPQHYLQLEERDPVEITYAEIDDKIEEFVKSGLLILSGYQYLVGSLLSSYLLETKIIKLCNEKMIDITNNLDKYTIKSIRDLFDNDITLQDKIYL